MINDNEIEDICPELLNISELDCAFRNLCTQRNDYKKEINLIINELDRGNIKVNQSGSSNFISYLNGLILLNNKKNFKVKNFNSVKIDDKDLIEKIWNHLGLIYVFTKTPGKKKDWPPVALKKGSNVHGLALHVHKDFIEKFKYARVWGNSVKFDGQQVGSSHILKSNDVVELHIK